MLAETGLLTAFLVGLMGAGHCAGMCGGIVGALSMSADQKRSPLGLLLGYNLGRLGSYTLAGAIMGGGGAMASHMSDLHAVQQGLQWLAGGFMLAMGLYIGGWWFGLRKVESAGAFLWRYLEPIGRKLLPVTSSGQALGLGAVWGWLPCGLVYSVLIWSLSSGSALDGAMTMLAFGLGTLPALLGMGLAAQQVMQKIQAEAFRQFSGLVIVLFGIYTLLQAAGLA